MSNDAKIRSYTSINSVAKILRDEATHSNILLFAYNGTGKTRLSMEFKSIGKRKGKGVADTLYYNAYTEDLFHWDNDLDGDANRYIEFNMNSKFFNGFKELEMDTRIRPYLQRYADFNFQIDYEKGAVIFSREVIKKSKDPSKSDERKIEQNIKVSRGEENIFIWCVYLAIIQLVIDGNSSYSWAKYLYIDDPISSLDDNNAIALASDLAQLLISGNDKVNVVISTHHGLFYNVMSNEFKHNKIKHKKYFLHYNKLHRKYALRATDETPFFHHVAMLRELQQAKDTNKIYTYHFNILRSIMEKTAVFFGYEDFSTCIKGVDDEVLYSRALNLLSHGKYSVYEPIEMVPDNKELFKNILIAFIDKYQFNLPEIFEA